MNELKWSAAAEAKRVLRLAGTATLATLDPTGGPFASMVTVATTPSGEPVLLLSDLAVHTRNLKGDPRASLLLVAPGGEDGDPLAGSRLTLVGSIVADDDPDSRRRFLARHEEAAGYAGFRDFGIFRLEVSAGHLVAGFGRIVDVERDRLLTDCASAADLVAAEDSAIAHMNADHRDAVRLYATRLLGEPDGDWRITGFDPEGADLRAGTLRARLPFDPPVTSAVALRRVLAALAEEARQAP